MQDGVTSGESESGQMGGVHRQPKVESSGLQGRDRRASVEA